MATSTEVYSRYGWRADRGDSVKARKNAVLEMPARVRRCVLAVVVRDRKALAAVLAEGRVRSVGTVRVDRV